MYHKIALFFFAFCKDIRVDDILIVKFLTLIENVDLARDVAYNVTAICCHHASVRRVFMKLFFLRVQNINYIV